MKINANAVEVLKQVVMQRHWHQGRIERRLAAVTKQNVLACKLSSEKASAILELLGWQKVKEEIWLHPTEEDRLKIAAQTSGEDHLEKSTAAIKAIYSEELKKPMSKKLKFSKKKG